MISAHVTGEKIVSTSSEAFSLYEKSRFGEKKDRKIEYSPVEALYLVSRGKLLVTGGTKELDEAALLRKFKVKDKKLVMKLAVFSDLRKKGYVVKTALKFGTEFRVYQKGVKPGEDHALWLVAVFRESDTLNWQDFAAKSRVAHSTRKNLLVAIVDEEESVTYYEVGWKKV